jgi:L-rhamnose isomerase
VDGLGAGPGTGARLQSDLLRPPEATDATLSHADDAVRSFWIEHGRASRRIASEMARRQGSPCINNHWIPDGQKDNPADRWGPRARLAGALDAVLADDPAVDRLSCVDCVESKLFGLGIESFTVGSAEFYSSYALSRGIVYCLDQGTSIPRDRLRTRSPPICSSTRSCSST